MEWIYGRNVLRPGQPAYLQIFELAALVFVLSIGKDLVLWQIRKRKGTPPESAEAEAAAQPGEAE